MERVTSASRRLTGRRPAAARAEVAKAMIGHAVGEIVTFMGNDYEIESIRKWNE